MRLIIAGSRCILFSFPLIQICYEHTRRFGWSEPIEVISGDAPRGPDQEGIKWAVFNAVAVRRMPAAWDAHGRAAGILRNEKMARYASELGNGGLFAIWDGESKGTSNMIYLAQACHLRVCVYRADLGVVNIL